MYHMKGPNLIYFVLLHIKKCITPTIIGKLCTLCDHGLSESFKYKTFTYNFCIHQHLTNMI